MFCLEGFFWGQGHTLLPCSFLPLPPTLLFILVQLEHVVVERLLPLVGLFMTTDSLQSCLNRSGALRAEYIHDTRYEDKQAQAVSSISQDGSMPSIMFLMIHYLHLPSSLVFLKRELGLQPFPPASPQTP